MVTRQKWGGVNTLVLHRPAADQASTPTPILAAAAKPVDQVLSDVGSSTRGLSTAEVTRRLAEFGPNAVRAPGPRCGGARATVPQRVCSLVNRWPRSKHSAGGIIVA